MEKIEVKYTELGPNIYHKYIVYTDNNGDQLATRAGPSAQPDDVKGWIVGQSASLAPSSGVEPWGTIVTYTGKYEPDIKDEHGTVIHEGFIDYDDEGDDPTETIKTGDDLSDYWQKITNAMVQIKRENHTYRPLTNNCNVATDEALARAGLPQPAQDGLGLNNYWSPGSGTGFNNSIAQIEQWIDRQLGYISNRLSYIDTGAQCIHALSPTLGTTPDPLVKTIRWITKDPLVLDLDGDGLEITPLKNGVMFDADGDTVKNASAWIGADDGLLVRDLDGNGVIDSGRELFGNNTRLANGQTAAHGFAALADLDTGSVVNGANGVMVGTRDGVIDARDAGFNELRVWRDLDQDGVSQANELATLTDADIAAIGLSNTAISKNYNGDATQTRSGSFTRADGSEGEAGNFLLAVNYFERAFAPVVVSETARALPDFKGTGWVNAANDEDDRVQKAA
jgi:hypothetical protein